MAHARRKFIETQAESPKAVRVAIKLIGRLYRLERGWDELDETKQLPPDAARRAQLRADGFTRTLRWLRQLAVHLCARMRPKSLLGQACVTFSTSGNR